MYKTTRFSGCGDAETTIPVVNRRKTLRKINNGWTAKLRTYWFDGSGHSIQTLKTAKTAKTAKSARKRQPAAVPDPPAAHQGFIRHRRTVGRIRPEADRQSRVRSVYRIPRRRLGQLRKRNRRGYFPLTPEQRSRSAARLRAQRRQSFPFETCGFGSIFPALSDDGELRRHTGIFYGATGENASGAPDGICRTAVNIAETWCFARSCPTDTGRTRNGSSRSEPETTGNLPAVQENQFYRPPCPPGTGHRIKMQKKSFCS